MAPPMGSPPLEDKETTPTQESFDAAQRAALSHLPPHRQPPLRKPLATSPQSIRQTLQSLQAPSQFASSAQAQASRSSADLPPVLRRVKTVFNLLGLLDTAQEPSASMTATTPARTGVSPSSSPRLPSPPPFTEVQIGPKSPTIGDSNQDMQLGDPTKPDDGALRRIRPGTKAADMNIGPPLVPLSQLDSPFQLQEHLKALYNVYTHTNSTTNPITRETALLLATPPTAGDQPVDRHLWLYELGRFLTAKANNLIIAFFAEEPPCSINTCPEMRASEWQYLCAVHDPPKSCCAIDYCCHTLDWACNILTSPKYFPSRLIMGGEQATGGVGTSMRHLTNIFRRVYRIFAHAWFQHRGVFWQVEGTDGLYIFFKTVCDVYQLVPEDNYTIPVEAEGVAIEESTPISTSGPGLHGARVLNRGGGSAAVAGDAQQQQAEAEATTTVSVGATTRRHKHTPSTGSHVTTIAEGYEDEDSANSKNLEVEDNEQEQVEDLAAKEPVATTQTLPHGLARLDLSAAKFGEVVVPEDPTPTPHDQDPMAAAGMEKEEGGAAAEETGGKAGHEASEKAGEVAGEERTEKVAAGKEESKEVSDENDQDKTVVVDDSDATA